MSVNESLATCNRPYLEQVYTGYSYLLKEASEILWHQFIYDPIQDTFIKLGFEKLIQYGHPQEAVNFHVNTGIHKILHDLLGNNAHGVTGFFYEIGIHAAVKVVATAAFPFLYPLQLTSYIPESIKEGLIEKPIKFMGIHPLEIVNSVKIIPDEILGMNNSISNSIDYLTLHTNHFQDRVDDPEYEIYMKSFNIWLESVDAVVHMSDDVSVLYNNRHLNGITQKAYYWVNLKYQMYKNSETSAFHHDHKIGFLRGSHDSDEYHTKTWKTMAYNTAYYAISFSLPTLVEKFYNYFCGNNIVDHLNPSQALVVAPETTATNLAFQATTNYLTTHTLSLAKRWHSESNLQKYFKTDIDSAPRTLSDSHLLEHQENAKTPPLLRPLQPSTERDLITPIDPQMAVSASEEELNFINDGGIYCGNDLTALIKSMMPSRYHVCTTPSHQAAIKAALTKNPSQHFSPKRPSTGIENADLEPKKTTLSFPFTTLSSELQEIVTGQRDDGSYKLSFEEDSPRTLSIKTFVPTPRRPSEISEKSTATTVEGDSDGTPRVYYIMNSPKTQHPPFVGDESLFSENDDV